MYARRTGERELTFDLAMGLIEDNLLVVDRETDSVWSQLHGLAVLGPLKGTPLEVLPSIQTTWAFWREQHPDTKVMSGGPREGRAYYYRNRPPGSRPTELETDHDVAALGFGLALGGQTLYFPFRELDRVTSPVAVNIGGRAVRVHYRREALTAWAEDENGELLPGVMAYADGWRRFHPDTLVYAADPR